MKSEQELIEAFETRFGKIDENGGYIGNLDLDSYQHPLPSSLRNCQGRLNLYGYKHPLPSEFQNCGGSLGLQGYGYPLPESFKSCGGGLFNDNYSFPIPDEFVDWNYKIISFTDEKYVLNTEKVSMEDEITKKQYRSITGSYEEKINTWMKAHKIKVERMKVKELLPLLEESKVCALQRFKSMIQ